MAKVLIVYATRTGNTALIATAIAEGVTSVGAEVIIKEAFYARAEDVAGIDGILVGSPTYYRDMVVAVNDFLKALSPELLRDKVSAAFGSYGWNGEAVIKIDEILTALGAKVLKPGLRIERRPGDAASKQCRTFGIAVAKKIEERSKP